MLRMLWGFPCALQRWRVQAGGSGSGVSSGVLRFVVCQCGEEGKADAVVYLPGQKSTMWLDTRCKEKYICHSRRSFPRLCFDDSTVLCLLTCS